MKYIISSWECIPNTQLRNIKKIRPDIYYIIDEIWECILFTKTKDNFSIMNCEVKDYSFIENYKINDNDELIFYNSSFIVFKWVFKEFYLKNFEFLNKFKDEKIYIYIFDLWVSFNFKNQIRKLSKKFDKKDFFEKILKKINNATFFSWNLYNLEKLKYFFKKQNIEIKKFFYTNYIWKIRKIINYKNINDNYIYDSIYYWTYRWWKRNTFIKKYYKNISWKHLLVWKWHKIIENKNIEFRKKINQEFILDFVNISCVSIMTWDNHYYDNSIHHRLIELSLWQTLILVDEIFDTKYKIFWEKYKKFYIKNKEDLENKIIFYKNNNNERIKDIIIQKNILEEKFKTNECLKIFWKNILNYEINKDWKKQYLLK